jgi:hypothetical protein
MDSSTPDHTNLVQICMSMYKKGFKFVCFDDREVTVYTDVSRFLLLSETPNNAFIFYHILPFCSMTPRVQHNTDCITFVGDIVAGSVIEFNDPRLKHFNYKDDDTDQNFDPIPKYFWRGIASTLNVSGVSIGSPPVDCLLAGHTVSIWNCIALNRIETINPQIPFSVHNKVVEAAC